MLEWNHFNLNPFLKPLHKDNLLYKDSPLHKDNLLYKGNLLYSTILIHPKKTSKIQFLCNFNRIQCTILQCNSKTQAFLNNKLFNRRKKKKKYSFLSRKQIERGDLLHLLKGTFLYQVKSYWKIREIVKVSRCTTILEIKLTKKKGNNRN